MIYNFTSIFVSYVLFITMAKNDIHANRQSRRTYKQFRTNFRPATRSGTHEHSAYARVLDIISFLYFIAEQRLTAIVVDFYYSIGHCLDVNYLYSKEIFCAFNDDRLELLAYPNIKM